MMKQFTSKVVACAMALALSTGSVAAVDQIAPGQLGGGEAHAASIGLRAGTISAGSSTATAKGSVSKTSTSKTTSYATIPIANGMYVMRSGLGRVLDVSGASKVNGGNVQIWDSNNTNAQKWNITHVSGGYYKIVNVNSGRALDVTAAGTRNGTNVRQWDYNGTAAQLWKPVKYGSAYVFVNKKSGRVLDVSGGVNANGRNVQIWDRNNTAAQRWTLTKTTSSSTGSPSNANKAATPSIASGMNATELALAKEIFNEYNKYRASRGLAKVAWSDEYARYGYNSASGCAKIKGLKHRLGIPVSMQDRVSDILQYSSWKMAGDEAVDKWFHSTGHRRMMQCVSAKNAAVGVYYDSANRLWYYAIVYDFVGHNQDGN